MYRDKQEELERLEKELLEQDEEEILEEEETGEAVFEEEDFQIGDAPAVYQNFSNNYGKDLRNFASGYEAYNADNVDTDLEEFSQEVLDGEPTAPVWIPILLTALIAAVVVAVVWIFFGVGGLK